MRFPISLLVLGVVAMGSGFCEAAPVRKIVPKGATNFTSKAQGFAVWLPGKSLENTQVLSEKPRFSTQHNFKLKSGPVAYSISIRPKQPLDGYFLSLLSDSEYRRYDEVKLGAISGRDIEKIFPNGIIIRNRLYLTSKLTYSVVATGGQFEMQHQAAQINRVFDSFRILPQK